MAPSDPHFVKELQTKHFDQRLWELYRWATFRELGYDVTQPEAPDFHIVSPRGVFTVEAATCAPSEGGVLADRTMLRWVVGSEDGSQGTDPRSKTAVRCEALRARSPFIDAGVHDVAHGRR